MRILEKAGKKCFYVETESDEYLLDKNPLGYRDSTPYIKRERHLPSGFEVIKLFDFDIKRIQNYDFKDHEYIITLRNPISAVASEKDLIDAKRSIGKNDKQTLNKTLRLYIDRYEYILANIINMDLKHTIVEFEKYPEVYEQFAMIVGSFDKALIDQAWDTRNSHFSTDKIPENLQNQVKQSEHYPRAKEVYSKINPSERLHKDRS